MTSVAKRLMRFGIYGLLFTLALTAPTHAEDSAIETVATLGKATPPGNIGIGPDGRVFLSVHGFYGQPTKVVELLPGGATRPYPTDEWATAPAAGKDGLHGVLGLNVDRQGVLWMLDGSGPDHAGRLVGWNTKSESLKQIVYLASPVIRGDSFLNDLAIDRTHDYVYIADTASGDRAAIVVVNLKTGQARRVLEGAVQVVAEDVDMVIDGRTIALGDKPARLGINPITIDPADEWVYFGAMSGTAIYRVRTTDLRDASLDPVALASRVERYGDKPLSDGVTIDGGGNVYITSITDNAIGFVGPDGKYKTLFQSAELSWPDGFAYGPDHNIYVTVNQLHRSPPLNGGSDGSTGEYRVMRFPALAPGSPGR